mmetsp:Transcript_14045/g.16322  ORF Transcript_14045/g.16322 Transcript_14045/m.16322 type:complete len:167 (-) Transcript_14045:70-570(-)
MTNLVSFLLLYLIDIFTYLYLVLGVSIIDQVKNVVKFREAEWKEISLKAKDFVSSLLTVNEDKRLTAQQALMHPWFNDIQKGNGNTTVTEPVLCSLSNMGLKEDSLPPPPSLVDRSKQFENSIENNTENISTESNKWQNPRKADRKVQKELIIHPYRDKKRQKVSA